jgi:exosortase/archaeosortase family protein
MSAVVAGVARPGRRITRVDAAVVAGVGLAILLTESHMRQIEAAASAFVLRLTHVAGTAHPTGSAVVFNQGPHWVGYSIAAGCTAALLIAPFFFVSAGLLLSRRVSLSRGLIALVVVTVLVWAVNQLRLLLIAASMQLWGFRTGYNRSHVLAGGVLSTFGVAIGVVIFVLLMIRERPSARGSK